VISSATVSLGSAGYIQQFIDLPQSLIVVVVVVALGLVASWGILESVLLASLFTLIEVGGLIVILIAAARADVPVVPVLLNFPSFESTTITSIAFATLLAFFAFIGFEDLANVVEEAKTPHRDLPIAMMLTLIITTLLYVAVCIVAVAAVSPERLATSPAPLSVVFREVARVSPATISAIAIVATLNTILAEMTMAARVIYGMALQGDLPRVMGDVHTKTATPLRATTIIVVVVLVLAMAVPFVRLAELTSVATLVVFALVNIALLRLRWKGEPARGQVFRVPIWIPMAGLVTCIVMIGSATLG